MLCHKHNFSSPRPTQNFVNQDITEDELKKEHINGHKAGKHDAKVQKKMKREK